jgi:hypothetical protein
MNIIDILNKNELDIIKYNTMYSHPIIKNVIDSVDFNSNDTKYKQRINILIENIKLDIGKSNISFFDENKLKKQLLIEGRIFFEINKFQNDSNCVGISYINSKNIYVELNDGKIETIRDYSNPIISDNTYTVIPVDRFLYYTINSDIKCINEVSSVLNGSERTYNQLNIMENSPVVNDASDVIYFKEKLFNELYDKINNKNIQYIAPTQEEFNKFFEENILSQIDYSKTTFLDNNSHVSKIPINRIQLNNSNGEWLFDYSYDQKHPYFWYQHDRVYLILNMQFLLQDNEIQQYMKSMIEKHFNFNFTLNDTKFLVIP